MQDNLTDQAAEWLKNTTYDISEQVFSIPDIVQLKLNVTEGRVSHLEFDPKP